MFVCVFVGFFCQSRQHKVPTSAATSQRLILHTLSMFRSLAPSFLCRQRFRPHCTENLGHNFFFFLFFNEPQPKRLPPIPSTPSVLQAEPPTPSPLAHPSNDPSTCRPRPSVAALLCCLSLQAAQTPLADLPAIRDLQSEEKKLRPPGFCFLSTPPPFLLPTRLWVIGRHSCAATCHYCS